MKEEAERNHLYALKRSKCKHMLDVEFIDSQSALFYFWAFRGQSMYINV